MAYLNTHARTTSPTNNDKFQPMGRTTSLFGVFVGFVKDAQDVQMNGRLRVWIPEFGSSPEDPGGWIIVNYCSPFAGATNIETISKSDVQSFEGTQTSYGMWMVPPDINNQVLVMFINGDASRGIWIGSLFNQYMNHMIPGMAADKNNWQYPGKDVPVAEYNKWDTRVTNPNTATSPVEKTKFQGVGNQGLITDQGRGITTSSARRESPSNVFGILTPGPAIDDTVPAEDIRRKGGSSFIMDDGTGSEYVQFTTKSGAQVRLDETNGFVYLINRDGTAWVQMDQQGNVDIFGATNVSMRAQKDINLRADRNINIEAGQNVFIKAAKDTVQTTTSFTYDVNNVPKPSTIPYWKYVGEGAGQGGNVVIQALNNMHTTVKQDSFTTIKRDANLNVTRNLFVTVGNNNDILVSNNLSINASSQISLTSPDVAVEGDLSVTGDTNISGATGIAGQLGVAGGAIIGPSVSLGSPGPVGTITPTIDATSAAQAEVKQLTEKINILATWADPATKFKRNAESMQTTVSVLPTYEPCPEHEKFTFASVTGYTPAETEAAKTYQGSGGAGSGATTAPLPNTDPGANNKDLPPTDANESALSKDFNMKAYECQLKIHEGVKYVSYYDSVNLATGGIGHLLRTNEIPLYPVPTPISVEQVSSWFQQDAPISIAGAQRLLGLETWGNLTDIRKRACADLCYNMGEGRLAKFKRFLTAMKEGNWDAAGMSLRDSKWFTQVGRRGPAIIAMVVNNVDPNGCDKKFPAT